MGLVAAWLLFPVALGAVCLGCGLLTERLAGRRLPGSLLVPLGLAVVLVVARLVTSVSAVAPLTLPVLLVLAAGGIVVSRERLRALRPDPFAVAAVFGVFAVLGAPTILTGEPTLAGALVLPDTAHQLVLADRLADAGHEWKSLPDSSYKRSVSKYFGTAYPVGGQAALGSLAPLGLVDLAWLYQPFLALLGATVALSLYALVARALERRVTRCLFAFVGAQPALVVAFAQQGSIKELAGLGMTVLTVAFVARVVPEGASARAVAPAAISSVAAAGTLGPPAFVYMAPPLALLVAAWLWRVRTHRPSRGELAWVAGLALGAVVLALPILIDLKAAFTVTRAALVGAASGADLGNLAAPLNRLQATGVHLAGDYRYPARSATLNEILTLLVAASAAVGLVLATVRRALGPLLLATTLGLGSAYLLVRGGPYADAKVLMLLSPAILSAAILTGLLVIERGRLLLGGALAVLVGGAVLVSNALLYHEAQPAPYARYSELADIGERLKGERTVMLTTWDEYAKYFLRQSRVLSQPEWPFPYAARDKRRHPGLKTPMDLDELPARTPQQAAYIVIPRSPAVSRPPSNFSRTFTGRYYEVWRRARPGVGTRLALGDNIFEPSAAAPCNRVRRLGRRARRTGGRLAYVERPALPMLDPLRPTFARAFGFFVPYPNYPRSIVVAGSGRGEARVLVPERGRFKLWLQGSFGRGVEVEIDGRRLGSLSYELGNPGQYLPVGEIDLEAGPHLVSIARGKGDLRPGNGGGYVSNVVHFGPLVFSSQANERREVRHVLPAEADRLCGRRLDWVEVVGPA